MIPIKTGEFAYIVTDADPWNKKLETAKTQRARRPRGKLVNVNVIKLDGKMSEMRIEWPASVNDIAWYFGYEPRYISVRFKGRIYDHATIVPFREGDTIEIISIMNESRKRLAMHDRMMAQLD